MNSVLIRQGVFVLFVSLLAPIYTHAESVSATSVKKDQRAYELGLYPISKKSLSFARDLLLLQEVPLDAGQAFFHETGWERSIDYPALLLYQASGIRPQIRTPNYQGIWSLQPTLVEQLGPLLWNAVAFDPIFDEVERDGEPLSRREILLQNEGFQRAWTQRQARIQNQSHNQRRELENFIRDFLFDRLKKRLHSTKRYQNARSWEKVSMDKNLSVEMKLLHFRDSLAYTFDLYSVPLGDLPMPIQAQALQHAQALLPPQSVYRIGLRDESLVMQVRNPLARDHKDRGIFTQVLDGLEWEESEFEAESGPENPKYATDAYLDEVLIAAGLFTKKMSDGYFRQLNRLREVHLQNHPELQRVLPLLEKEGRAIAEHSERIRQGLASIQQDPRKLVWMRRLLPQPSALERYVDTLRSLRGTENHLHQYLNPTKPSSSLFARGLSVWRSSPLVSKMVLGGVISVLALDAKDLFESRHDTTRVQLQKTVQLALNSSLSFYFLRSHSSFASSSALRASLQNLGKANALAVGLGVTLWAGQKYVHSDIYTFGDLHSETVNFVTDGILFLTQDAFPAMKGKPPSPNIEWNSFRAKELQNFVITSLRPDDLIAQEASTEDEILDAISKNSMTVALSPDSFQDLIVKFDERIEDMELRREEVSRLIQRYAKQYAVLLLYAHHWVGSVPQSHFWTQLDYLVFENLPFGHFSSAHAQMRDKMQARAKILPTIEKEIERFLEYVHETQEKYREINPTADIDDVREPFAQHVWALIGELESCLTLTWNATLMQNELREDPNCTPSESQKAIAQELVDLLYALEPMSIELSNRRP